MAAYVRVSILGTFGTEDVWSVNPVFDPFGEFPGGVNQSALDTATLAIANRSIPTSLRENMSTSFSRNGARVEVREQTNDALIGISTQASTTAMAGINTMRMPAQAATVFSLRTDTPGASGRGRLYWPAAGNSITTSGRLNNPHPSVLVTDMKAYLNGIRSDLAAAFPTIGFDLAVRSKVTLSTPHVVRIQVGNVPDTQRRRRDTIQESYVQTTFP